MAVAFLVSLENLACLEFLDVQVPKVHLAMLVSLAGLALLEGPELLVILDPQVSLDLQENKVHLELWVGRVAQVVWAAALASDTPLLSTARTPRFPCVPKAWLNYGMATVCCM